MVTPHDERASGEWKKMTYEQSKIEDREGARPCIASFHAMWNKHSVQLIKNKIKIFVNMTLNFKYKYISLKLVINEGKRE